MPTRKWTLEDDKTLVEMHLAGSDYDSIARELKRTLEEVQCRFVKTFVRPQMYGKVSKEVVDRYSQLYKINADDFARFLTDTDYDDSISELSDTTYISISDDDTDENFEKLLQKADKKTLKYLKYKFLYRLELINKRLA